MNSTKPTHCYQFHESDALVVKRILYRLGIYDFGTSELVNTLTNGCLKDQISYYIYKKVYRVFGIYIGAKTLSLEYDASSGKLNLKVKFRYRLTKLYTKSYLIGKKH